MHAICRSRLSQVCSTSNPEGLAPVKGTSTPGNLVFLTRHLQISKHTLENSLNFVPGSRIGVPSAESVVYFEDFASRDFQNR